MTDFDTVDFFTDEPLVPDPYPYFDYLRSKCPVAPATPYGVLAVTGDLHGSRVFFMHFGRGSVLGPALRTWRGTTSQS